MTINAVPDSAPLFCSAKSYQLVPGIPLRATRPARRCTRWSTSSHGGGYALATPSIAAAARSHWSARGSNVGHGRRRPGRVRMEGFIFVSKLEVSQDVFFYLLHTPILVRAPTPKGCLPLHSQVGPLEEPRRKPLARHHTPHHLLNSTRLQHGKDNFPHFVQFAHIPKKTLNARRRLVFHSFNLKNIFQLFGVKFCRGVWFAYGLWREVEEEGEYYR